MNDAHGMSERPAIITVICVIGLINAIQMVNLVFSPMSNIVQASGPDALILAI